MLCDHLRQSYSFRNRTPKPHVHDVNMLLAQIEECELSRSH